LSISVNTIFHQAIYYPCMITYLPVGSKHHLSIQSPLAASIVECHMLRKKSEYHYMIAILPRHSYKSKYNSRNE